MIKNFFFELIHVIKNTHKIVKFIFNINVQKIKKIKKIRKYYNVNNINSSKTKFDYFVTSLDGSIFLMDPQEYKLYSDHGIIKQNFSFDYHTNPLDVINKFLIKHFVKKGDQVVDVGTHIGIYSAYLANIVGEKGKVFCFEPHKDLTIKLNSNLSLNGLNNYEIHNYGLGENNEVIDYNSVNIDNFNEGTVNSSFYENEKISSPYFKGKFQKIKTKVKKLDSVLTNEKIKFVKIDTEGYELKILKGMQNIINRCRPIIIFEFHSPRIKYLKINLKSFQDLLLDKYDIYKILLDIKSGNIVFKKYNFVKLDNFSGDLICLPKNNKQFN